MNKLVTGFILVLLSMSTQATTKLNLFACEPEWAALAKELGAKRITTYSATNAFQDPHHIEARPSLIAKVRQADLIICSGADLEAGWLPMLLRQASNRRVLPGQAGYFEAANQVDKLDMPAELDRALGDVHAAGNPHVHLDPRRIHSIAKALSQRLTEIDPEGEAYYQQRYNDFSQRWLTAIDQWQVRAEPLKGKRIVIHHRDWVYLFDWLGIEIAGTLEPRPGLPTTVAHLASLKKALDKTPASMIVHTPYQNTRAAKRLSSMLKIPIVKLPYTVGGSDQTSNLFALFNAIIDALIRNRK